MSSKVYYCNRPEILWHLYRLMKTVLTPQERRLIFRHCGFFGAPPVSFAQLAQQTKLASAKQASALYAAAIHKTRRAIPDSAIAAYVVGLDCLSEAEEQ